MKNFIRFVRERNKKYFFFFNYSKGLKSRLNKLK